MSSLVRAYGWRIYALPVLVVITALVLWDTTRAIPDDGTQPANRATNDAFIGGSGGAGGDSGGDASSGDPGAVEQPAAPVDLNIPTAELPVGGRFTQGAGRRWRTVPGGTPRIGTGGRLYTYTVDIEEGIDPVEFGGDAAFARFVDETLADPRGWTSGGTLSVQRVDASARPDFRISLTSPDTTHGGDLCGFSIKYESSCYRSGVGRVVINLARWVRGATAFSGNILLYQQYAINHEVGHAFDNGHVGCRNNGELAPVMMQQSFGVRNDYVAQLNDVRGGDRNSVPADDKVCTPNPWPNPQGRPAG